MGIRYNCLIIVSLLLALVLSLGVVLVSPMEVHARQGQELTIAQMKVSLWPEYDDPRLLVIYRGRFAAGSLFPQVVTFRIPTGAQVHAAAYIAPDGTLYSQPWEATTEGDFQLVRYTLPVDTFQLEFYHDVIEGQADKSFTFTLQSLYPVDLLEIEVQQPLRASNFTVLPEPGETTVDASGFRYALYSFEGVARDEKIELDVSYTKSDPNPSVPKAQLTPVSEPRTTVPGPKGQIPLLPIVLATLALLAALASIASILRSRRGGIPYLPAALGGGGREEVEGYYCTRCGARLREGDRFCWQCGQKTHKISTSSS